MKTNIYHKDAFNQNNNYLFRYNQWSYILQLTILAISRKKIWWIYWSSLVEMWPPVTYTEGIPDRKHSGYIQYTYRGFTFWQREKASATVFISNLAPRGHHLQFKNIINGNIRLYVFFCPLYIFQCTQAKNKKRKRGST